jgi:hypothetical protein
MPQKSTDSDLSPDQHDTSIKDRRYAVRHATIEALLRLANPKRLRMLTLGEPSLIHEQIILDNSDLQHDVEEIVSPQGEKASFSRAQSLHRSLPAAKQRKLILTHADGHKVLAAALNPSGAPAAVAKAKPQRGFDLVWLGWRTGTSQHPHPTSELLGSNLFVFERAWDKGNPGLLYLTLECCSDDQADLSTLHLTMASFTTIPAEHDGAEDRVSIRNFGLATLLNNYFSAAEVTATPTHGFFYRDGQAGDKTMFFAGFELRRKLRASPDRMRRS